MVFRFFAFIWGAILLTLLLFAVLIATLDWRPPDSARLAIARDVLTADLSRIAEVRGLAEAKAVWESIASQHPGLVMALKDECRSTGESLAVHNCLTMLPSEDAPQVLGSIEPIFVPLAIGAVVSALGAILLSRLLSRPIRTVSAGLKELAGGRLETRIGPARGGGEFAELVTAFDHAASQLQELTESRQQLFHDISHEIRSPLARLRAAIGLAEVSPTRLPGLVAQMEGDIGRLDQLVGEILTLARYESGQHTPQTEALDLVDILELIVEDANFEGAPKAVSVHYSGPDALSLRGDPELLHRAFENIIRNALSYAPDGSTVTVVASDGPDSMTVTVSDEGPGVEEADLKTLFTPFVRVGAPGSPAGVGLGLAIAASAVEAHGGRIVASNRNDQGLSMRVVMPR